MTNIQPSFQMTECDQETAEQHMAMAEMMNEDDDGQVADPTPMDQTNLMQFSMTSGSTYENKDQMYAYQINDYGYYFNSFNSTLPAAEIDSIESKSWAMMHLTPNLLRLKSPTF